MYHNLPTEKEKDVRYARWLVFDADSKLRRFMKIYREARDKDDLGHVLRAIDV